MGVGLFEGKKRTNLSNSGLKIECFDTSVMIFIGAVSEGIMKVSRIVIEVADSAGLL